jgi:small-conductance mechanosensitive channel
VRWFLKGKENVRAEFWTRQGVSLAMAVLMVVGILSIWFDDPARLATGLGLLTAGLAFALQKVVTSIAGYVVILRGRTFNVGDRITMGGVRGDVIALNFTQTTIMEMGQPHAVQSAEPAMWVRSRQYTGRIVTVPNSKIFDEPVYNYTRDFEFIWEELSLPVPYSADRERAEQILLDAAGRHHSSLDTMDENHVRVLQRRYYVVHLSDFRPRVFYRLTDNWLELTVRFVTRAHGVRDVKDAMSRQILASLETSGIPVASSTFEVTVHAAENGAGDPARLAPARPAGERPRRSSSAP